MEMANPTHSAASMQTIERSKEISRWIFNNAPSQHTFDPLPDNTDELRLAESARKRHTIAVSLWQIALDHHTAITFLCDNHMRSSAFSLARCMFDATWKGAWIEAAASDELLEQFSKGHFEPKASSSLKPLEKALDSAPFFTKVYNQAWGILCDYNHSGKQQIESWWGEGEIASQHTDDEMKQILGLCDQLALCCAVFLTDICDRDTTAVKSKFNEVFELE
jgi:hypothetical protein